MSSQQRTIRNAVVTLLEAIPGVHVFRSPRFEIAEAELPALAVFSHGDRPEDQDDDHQKSHRRTYTLRVEIRAKGRPEEDATDDLAVAVRKAILADDSLGGLVHRITWAEQAWDGDEGEFPLAGTYLDFNVFYLWRPE